MLKIKDNVDLKELEKYNFSYAEEDKMYSRIIARITAVDTSTFYERLEIYEKDRIIKSRLYNDLSNMYWYSTQIRESHCIQDLIQAGLVEKVEE